MAERPDEHPDAIPEELTIETVRNFLLQRKGKVRQSELVDHFNGALSTEEGRESCKNILQLITATKTEHGEKYLVLVNNKSQDKRKARTPLFFRKNENKNPRNNNNNNFLAAPTSPKRSSLSDQEDNSLGQRPVSATSIESTDSAHGSVDNGSSTPIPTVRSKKHDKKKRGKHRSKSSDSGESAEIESGEVSIGAEILPEEKEWFLAAASGRMDRMRKLLDVNPGLSANRDFVFGYTALHWAAKLGRVDIVNMMIRGCGVDVHTKSHAGYTPLHVAAMSGKEAVMRQLIETHHADIHVRDHSGKKPKDVVKETTCAEVQRRLGRTVILAPSWVISTVNARKMTAMSMQPSLPS